MKFLAILLPVSLLCAHPLSAQAPLPQSAPTLTPTANNTWNLAWTGILDRTYFLQCSPDLEQWIYLPNSIETGTGQAINYGLSSPNQQAFFRLAFSDITTSDADTADFDGDGIGNLLEINAGTDPLDLDTDDDGLTNAEEAALGTSMTNPDSDGDGITDGGEVEEGTDPNDANDIPDAEWLTVTGDLAAGEVAARNRSLTIPAGESRLVIVAIASDEYPIFTSGTEETFEYNDVLTWEVKLDGDEVLSNRIDVNARNTQWDEALANGQTLRGFDPVHFEAVKLITAPADADGQVEIELSAMNVEDGIHPSTVVVGLLPVEVGIYPTVENSDNSVEISEDDAEQELAMIILLPDLSQDAEPRALVEVEDGTVVEWEIFEGNGSISTQQTTTTNGVAVTTLTTSTTPGDTYKVEARITTLNWNGDSLDLGDAGMIIESDTLEVVSGEANTIEVTRSKDEYSSDATDEVEIEITVKDQNGNLLEDGTPVTWILDKSTGGFAKTEAGDEKVESELTGGKAKVSLRAPTMPFDQNLIVIVDELTEEISMKVNRVTGSISSSSTSLDLHTADNATITVDANAADETPVYWFSSNGSMTPDTSNLSNGQATATLSTTGGRIGKTVVTATVGDRMFIWEGDFTSSAPVQVSFENPCLIGGIQSDGDPPQNDNGEDYQGPWFVLTKGRIRAPGFGGQPATVTTLNGGSLVQITGLNGSNQITLDQNGYAEFEIASAGAQNQFGRVDIRVQVNPEGADYVEIIEPTPWTHVGDFFGGLIGLDTSTGTGVVTSIVGGYILIGDVGVIVKNSVRNAGWSDKEPNNFELAMGGVGLLGTFSGPGDGIVSAIRIIIQRIGNTPLADVLMRVAKNIIAKGKLPSAAEQSFVTILKNDAAFSIAVKDVLTDDALYTQAVRGIEKLGDPFANAVKNAATSPSLGILTSQKIVDVVSEVSDDVLDGLKNSGQLDDALVGLTKAVDTGVNPRTLAKTLNNPDAFIAGYQQADLLVDTKRLIENSPGIKIFKEQFAEMAKQGATQRQGRTFELLAAARRSSAEAITNLPGKSSTKGKYFIDVDFESATSLYQVTHYTTKIGRVTRWK